MSEQGSKDIITIDIVADGDLTDEKCERLISYEGEELEKLERKGYGRPQSRSQKPDFAKVVIAMANTRGGYILLGVDNNRSLVGIGDASLDPSDLGSIVSTYVYPEIKNLSVRVFAKDGKNIGVVFVPSSDHLPHVTKIDGGGGNILKKNTIYVRHSGESEPANYQDIQIIISKALQQRQGEMSKYLEETELHKDVRLIKEHLLGTSSRKDNIEHFIFSTNEEFLSELESHTLYEHTDELRIAGKLLSKTISTKWKGTQDLEPAKVQEIRDLYVIRLLDRLTYICLALIDEDVSDEQMAVWFKTFADIYCLARHKHLGSRQIDDWNLDGSGRKIGAKTHLSYTVPSKEALKRMLVIAAYLVHKERWETLANLSQWSIDWRKYNSVTSVPMLIHPAFDYHSGEGSLMSLFDEARELSVQDKIVYSYFDKENEQSLNDLLAADFLISFILTTVAGGEYGFRRFINFPRFLTYRLEPLIRRLNREPASFGKSFPDFSSSQLSEYVQFAGNFATKNFWLYSTNWDQSGNKELLG